MDSLPFAVVPMMCDSDLYIYIYIYILQSVQRCELAWPMRFGAFIFLVSLGRLADFEAKGCAVCLQ